VVENDPFINLNIVATIESSGLDAREVYKADDALALLQERTDISVLFTAVDIGGPLDGRELAHEARRMRPSIGLIIATALAQSEVGELPPGAIYLGKPFTQSQVETAIAQAMFKRTDDA
jgi:DNA-binding response OmpR family regulator